MDIGVVGIDKISSRHHIVYFGETTTPIGGILWT